MPANILVIFCLCIFILFLYIILLGSDFNYFIFWNEYIILYNILLSFYIFFEF